MTEITEEITERADRLYKERARGTEPVRQSVLLLERAGTSFEALWRKGRAHFFLGQEADDESDARFHHRAGARAAKRAARMQRARVEGHFWLGVNLALLARQEIAHRALFHALKARRALWRAVHLDPAYHAAGPLRVLARLESKLPRLVGGSRERARRRYEQAIKLAPANTVTRLYFAELLAEMGDHMEARAQLETLLNSPDDAAWDFEIKRDRAQARKLLNELVNGQ